VYTFPASDQFALRVGRHMLRVAVLGGPELLARALGEQTRLACIVVLERAAAFGWRQVTCRRIPVQTLTRVRTK